MKDRVERADIEKWLNKMENVLDKVKGAQHFDLRSSEIDHIYTDVLASLPGYLVPKLVREIAGEKNKTPLFGATTF